MILSALASSGESSEQFWMYLNLDMVAPQTFARTFTKPGSSLYKNASRSKHSDFAPEMGALLKRICPLNNTYIYIYIYY